MAVLARGDASRREAAAVTQTLDVIDDRNFRIARQQEVGVHRMRRPAGLDGAYRGDQRLADDLAAEHALPAALWRVAAEQIDVQFLEIEDGQQVFNGRRHKSALWRPEGPR